MSGFAILTGLLLTLSVTILFLVLRLETTIRVNGIYVRFFPFHQASRYYSWDTIRQLYVRQYNPIGEFGGWGIRGFGKNRAFNVSGNTGIQLVLQNGSRILIGTNKGNEAARVLELTGHLTTS
jgi:hypothetical protein